MTIWPVQQQKFITEYTGQQDLTDIQNNQLLCFKPGKVRVSSFLITISETYLFYIFS